MARRNQVYKVTYPNGKIYAGMDLTGTLLCVGNSGAQERIGVDLHTHRLDLILRKQILWGARPAGTRHHRGRREKRQRHGH